MVSEATEKRRARADTRRDKRRAFMRSAKTGATERWGMGGLYKGGAHAPRPVTKVKVNLRSIEEIEEAARRNDEIEAALAHRRGEI